MVKLEDNELRLWQVSYEDACGSGPLDAHVGTLGSDIEEIEEVLGGATVLSAVYIGEIMLQRQVLSGDRCAGT